MSGCGNHCQELRDIMWAEQRLVGDNGQAHLQTLFHRQVLSGRGASH